MSKSHDSFRIPQFAGRKKGRLMIGVTQKYCGASVSLASLLGACKSSAFDSFSDGTNYVSIGDSITHSGAYLTYLETFFLTRFPIRKVEMLNLGIAGDTTSGALARFSWDIEPQHPVVASVMFGMNDVTRSLYESTNVDSILKEKRKAKILEFRSNLASLVKKLIPCHAGEPITIKFSYRLATP